MTKVGSSHNECTKQGSPRLLTSVVALALSAVAVHAWGQDAEPLPSGHGHIQHPFVVTQLPAGTEIERQDPVDGAMLRANYGDRARLVMVNPDSSVKVLSEGFHSACDPEVSFDASHILFAAKREAEDDWNIFEMSVDGSEIRQITRGMGDCRKPGYQATLYTIVSPKPWYQLTYVGAEEGIANECGVGAATNLYSCKLDGSTPRRLTFNLSSDMDPFIMPDGRLLFASWQRSRLDRGLSGRIGLFGVNIDGADFAVFSVQEGKRIKHMPCTTTKGLAVFVEADEIAWDGAGSLGCVRLRRPLHSYRPVTAPSDGLFHSPSPLPDGHILVSRRSLDGRDTHGVYRLDPGTGQHELLFDSPGYHDIQAKAVFVRPEPDGRSSVVTEKDPHGQLYCLNVYINDLARPEWLPRGSVKRLRVLEGIPVRTGQEGGAHAIGPSPNGIPPLAQRRILGEIDVAEDGSFNIEVPANTAIELQILDADGMALRSCGWIWAKNHEPRGCIGCHEDGELTPENLLFDAISKPSVQLTLPPEQRRTVDFRRDVMPIIAGKCVRCHANAGPAPCLTPNLSSVKKPTANVRFNRSYMSLLAGASTEPRGEYVHPGRARTSPLVWHIFGRNTSRPWDKEPSQTQVPRMPPAGAEALTEDERRTVVEWIDMGALWDGIAGPDNLPGQDNLSGESDR